MLLRWSVGALVALLVVFALAPAQRPAEARRAVAAVRVQVLGDRPEYRVEIRSESTTPVHDLKLRVFTQGVSYVVGGVRGRRDVLPPGAVLTLPVPPAMAARDPAARPDSWAVFLEFRDADGSWWHHAYALPGPRYAPGEAIDLDAPGRGRADAQRYWQG